MRSYWRHLLWYYVNDPSINSPLFSRLNFQVEFQHSQLLNKREKAETLQGEVANNMNQRETSLIKMRGLVHQQRDKNQQIVHSLVTGGSEKSAQASKELLHLELANDHDGHNLKKWCDWVQAKIQFVSDQCEHKSHECARLENIVEGYRKNMNLSLMESNEKENTPAEMVSPEVRNHMEQMTNECST